MVGPPRGLASGRGDRGTATWASACARRYFRPDPLPRQSCAVGPALRGEGGSQCTDDVTTRAGAHSLVLVLRLLLRLLARLRLSRFFVLRSRSSELCVPHVSMGPSLG